METWIDGCMDTSIYGQMYRWIDKSMDVRMDRCMYAQIDGQMDRWIDGQRDRWQLSGQLFNQPTSHPVSQLSTPKSVKLDPKSNQHPPSWDPKSTKLGPKIHQNLSWRVSWRGLGPILAPRGLQEPKCSKTQTLGPPTQVPSWSSKLSKNRSRSGLGSDFVSKLMF